MELALAADAVAAQAGILHHAGHVGVEALRLAGQLREEDRVEIFDRMSGDTRYHLDESGRQALAKLIEAEPRTRGFGNARFVRNVFEEAVGRQAERLASVEDPSEAELTTLTAADITDA